MSLYMLTFQNSNRRLTPPLAMFCGYPYYGQQRGGEEGNEEEVDCSEEDFVEDDSDDSNEDCDSEDVEEEPQVKKKPTNKQVKKPRKTQPPCPPNPSLSELIVRKRQPKPGQSKGQGVFDEPTPAEEEILDNDEGGAVSKGKAEQFVSDANTLGVKFNKAKTTQQRMLAVSKLNKGQLKLFEVVIRNVWEGEHGAFQLLPEEITRMKKHKHHFKEFMMKKTTLKRKREILQEGTILRNLANLMVQLEVD